MSLQLKSIVPLLTFCAIFSYGFGQNKQPYTASFIGRMGIDTVLIETYTMINNHLYGKAFIRVPEDYIGEFNIHFYPDGSIREFDVIAMDPFNSSIPFPAKTGYFPYRYNMNCTNDTCTFYSSEKNQPTEAIAKHATPKMDFVGGWVPLISLMEWNCMRLAQSGKQALPLRMINSWLGVYQIGVQYSNKDTVVFGGPFIEYTKINVNAEGKILNTNGIGTPWNYYVTKHDPIDVDQIAKRIAKTPGIGLPSPDEKIEAVVQGSKIEVKYGRPFKRGRKIFGGVVPHDSLWRTGAGSATILSLEHAIRIGKTTIPKGQYSLYTIPKEREWLLIFNTDVTTWPTNPNRQKDFAQVVIPVKRTESIKEQFLIEVQETKKGGILKFQWDDVMAYTEFSIVKN